MNELLLEYRKYPPLLAMIRRLYSAKSRYIFCLLILVLFICMSLILKYSKNIFCRTTLLPHSYYVSRIRMSYCNSEVEQNSRIAPDINELKSLNVTSTADITYVNDEIAKLVDIELMSEINLVDVFDKIKESNKAGSIPPLDSNGEIASTNVKNFDSNPGFTIEQLMELAGLSVAAAVVDYLHLYPPMSVGDDMNTNEKSKDVLVVCGPGNNGGDGLVAARHLHHFGYKPTIYYPSFEKLLEKMNASGNAETGTCSNGLTHTEKHYVLLLQQCVSLGISVKTESDMEASTGSAADTNVPSYVAIIDSLFGFSFKGPGLRSPYDVILKYIQALQTKQSVPIISVDIPSGWDVNSGDVGENGSGLLPNAVVSLTTPKLCMKKNDEAKGGIVHYLGGR